MNEKIQLLLVDDHAVVRQGLRMFLTLDPALEIAAEATNGREALDMVSEHAPDVVLRDLSNKQTARALDVSDLTVKTHVSSLLAQLGLASRTQAAIFALREGLVGLD